MPLSATDFLRKKREEQEKQSGFTAKVVPTTVKRNFVQKAFAPVKSGLESLMQDVENSTRNFAVQTAVNAGFKFKSPVSEATIQEIRDRNEMLVSPETAADPEFQKKQFKDFIAKKGIPAYEERVAQTKKFLQEQKESFLKQQKEKEEWVKKKAKVIEPRLFLVGPKLTKDYEKLKAKSPERFTTLEKEYEHNRRVSAFLGGVVQAFDADITARIGNEERARREAGQALLGFANPQKMLTGLTLDIIDGDDLANLGQDVYHKNGKLYYRGFEVGDEYLSLAAHNTRAAGDIFSTFVGALPTYALGSAAIKIGVGAAAATTNTAKVAQGFAKLAKSIQKAQGAYPILTEITAYNVMEETAEAVVRRSARQDYTFNHFMNGLVWGAGLGGSLMLAGKAVKSNLITDVLKQVETRLKAGDTIEGAARVINLEGRNLDAWYRETKLAYLKEPGEGRPGIEKPAPLPEPKGEEALYAEARKYKSAAEFVKNAEDLFAKRQNKAFNDPYLKIKYTPEEATQLKTLDAYLQSPAVIAKYDKGLRDPEILTDLYNSATGKGAPSPKERGEAEIESLKKERAEVEQEIKTRAHESFERDYAQLKTQIDEGEAALQSNPARELMKYANKRTLEINEVTGEKGKGIFGKEGDQVAQELGFADSESARDAFEKYAKQKKKIDVLKEDLIKMDKIKTGKAFIETEIQRRMEDDELHGYLQELDEYIAKSATEADLRTGKYPPHLEREDLASHQLEPSIQKQLERKSQKEPNRLFGKPDSASGGRKTMSASQNLSRTDILGEKSDLEQDRLQSYKERLIEKDIISEEDISVKQISKQVNEPIGKVRRVLNAIKKIGVGFIEYAQNEQVRVMKLIEKIEEEGSDIADLSNPYLKATLYHGRVQTKIDRGNEAVKSLVKDMQKLGDDSGADLKTVRKEINDYLLAQHAPERNAALGDGAAGITTAQAKVRLAELEASPRGTQIKELADRALKLNEETLDTLLESGVISEDLYKTLRNKYKKHVPLQRIFEEEQDIGGVLSGRGFDVKSTGIKRAKGSEREVGDILANIVTNYEQAVLRAEKNIVDQATLAFARENSDTLKGIVEETELPIVPVAKVKHTAAIDIDFQDQLVSFARKLGAKFKTTGQPGSKLGAYYPGAELVTRKFATPREVLSHEMGHFFDDMFGLRQRFFKRGETKAVAEEMLAHMKRAGESGNRMSKTGERFADSFEWWLTHREQAKYDLPLFSEAMDDIIAEIPQLKPLLDIKPSPRFTLEQMEELVFARQKFTNDPTILSMFENGKPKYVKIYDLDLAIALKNVGREKIPTILKPVAWFTRLYSGLATRFNPEFALPNKIRDLQETAVFLASQKDIKGKGAFRTVVRDLKQQSTIAVLDALRGKDTEGARLYNEMKELGGTTGGFGLSTKKKVELDLETLEKIANSKTRQIADNFLEYVDAWNTIFEDSTRLSVYKQALEQGATKDRAAFLAKEASINFNRMGRGGPLINALYMFSNASIQGSTKMLRSLKNPRVLLGVTLTVGTAVTAVNQWNDQVDPDWRNKVSKWDRLNGLTVMMPSTKEGEDTKYITIPVSWGLKPIKVMADYVYDSVSGADFNIGDATSDIISTVIEAYNPTGGTDLRSALMPSIGDIPDEITRNRAWHGGKIRPERMFNEPDDILYFQSLEETKTGQIAISISEALQEHGSIAISPANIKYAVDQAVGGAGRTLTRAVNLVTGIGTGKLPPPDEYPFISRFYRIRTPEEVETSASAGSAREQKEELNELLAEQARGRFDLKRQAQALYQELKDIDPAEANARAKALKTENPALHEKLKDIANEEKLGLTYNEKKMKGLGVENGERAKYIWGELEKRDTPAEKNAYMKELRKKKVLTDNVRDQLKEFVKSGGPEDKPDDNALKDKAKAAKDDKSMADVAKLYVKAFGVDPLTAIKTLFTKEQLKDVRGDAVIMERMGVKASSAVKRKGGAGPTDKLDHTIPLELGGDNSEDNLRIVTEAEWKSYTPVENYLGKLLNKEKVSKKEARDMITDFKKGKITFDEIKKRFEDR